MLGLRLGCQGENYACRSKTIQLIDKETLNPKPGLDTRLSNLVDTLQVGSQPPKLYGRCAAFLLHRLRCELTN